MAHQISRRLPPALAGLEELALDLRWNRSHIADPLWQMLDEEAWARSRNPYLVLQNASEERLEQAAQDREIVGRLELLLETRRQSLESPAWFEGKYSGSPLTAIAYFSMEFGLGEALPIYSGGLGLLAGDHLKSASDLGVPLTGIGLLYQQGYFRQMLARDGGQLEAFPYNDPVSLPIAPVLNSGGGLLRFTVDLPGRSVFVRAWRAQIGRIFLYLLDCNDPLNGPWDRGITSHLYPPESEQRLIQEIVLGIGGSRLLRRLGLETEVYHLNEGHAAFAIVGRALDFMERNACNLDSALWATRGGNVFTTHTPIAAAFDRYDPELIDRYARNLSPGVELPVEELLALGRVRPEDRHEAFTPAYLALRGSAFANGVSHLHGSVSRDVFQPLFPRWPSVEVPVGNITNGIHLPSWHSQFVSSFWRKPPLETGGNGEDRWEPQLPTSDQKLCEARCAARKQLVEYVRERLANQVKQRGLPEEIVDAAGHVLDPDVLTIGLARRFVEYKRPGLILRDPERLRRLLFDAARPVQLIVAGKAHPNDDFGKQLVKLFGGFVRSCRFQRIVFVEDYDIELARYLVAGVDLWLNTPRRPWEACGTSGMKILANGGLNLSTLDGWWAEAYGDDVGWAIGDGGIHGPEHDSTDAELMYSLLEQRIVPEFYCRNREGLPAGWIGRIRASMAKLTDRFSSSRMLLEYVGQAYLPAASAYRQRCRIETAREVVEWNGRLSEHWQTLRFGSFRTEIMGADTRFEVELFLGELRVEDIEVQLYANATGNYAAEAISMTSEHPIPGTANGLLFCATVSGARSTPDYTPRVIPRHQGVQIPIEQSRILWLH